MKKETFNQICKDIKSIKIQGARNVAKAGLKAYQLKPTKDSKLHKINVDFNDIDLRYNIDGSLPQNVFTPKSNGQLVFNLNNEYSLWNNKNIVICFFVVLFLYIFQNLHQMALVPN